MSFPRQCWDMIEFQCKSIVELGTCDWMIYMLAVFMNDPEMPNLHQCTKCGIYKDENVDMLIEYSPFIPHKISAMCNPKNHSFERVAFDRYYWKFNYFFLHLQFKYKIKPGHWPMNQLGGLPLLFQSLDRFKGQSTEGLKSCDENTNDGEPKSWIKSKIMEKAPKKLRWNDLSNDFTKTQNERVILLFENPNFGMLMFHA